MKNRLVKILVFLFFLFFFLPFLGNQTVFAASIYDDAYGGDCSSIGNWDAATKTCTLTTDLTETVRIESDGIVLDGNGHLITGSIWWGVYLSGRTGVSVKNLSLKQVTYPIYLDSSSGNTISDNAISNSYYGIYLQGSNSNTLTNNTISMNEYKGISFVFSNDNTLTGNTIIFPENWSGRPYFDYAIDFYSSHNNLITGNTALNGRNGITFFESSGNIIGSNTVSNSQYGIRLESCTNNDINNNTVSNHENGIVLTVSSTGNTLEGNTLWNNKVGILFWQSDSNDVVSNTVSYPPPYDASVYAIHIAYSNNNNVNGNTVSNGYEGIGVHNSSGNSIDGNIVSDNRTGILFWNSDNGNKIENNNVHHNDWSGIGFANSSNNLIKGNTVSDNYHGMFAGSANNQIYNNNFLRNTIQAVNEGSGNIFNLDAPTGGNYWDTFDTPEEGCHNLNGDNFCDAPYVFSGAQDNLPWTNQDGWVAPPVKTVTIDIKPGISPSCINNDGNGVIPVAILSTADFDATKIDPASVSLDGQSVRVAGKSNKLLAHQEDINSDGLIDLVLQIQDFDGAYQPGSTTATLTGKTFDGMSIKGTDEICILLVSN